MVKSVVNKVMWVESPEVLTLDVAAMLAAALIASVLVLVVVMRPADAAFPGVNGLIVFDSDRITITNPTGDPEIYTIDPTNPNGTLTQLTDNTAFDGFPAFSLGGTQIVFASNRVTPTNPAGDYEIYMMDANGSNQTNISNNNTAQDFFPAFSPSGQKIVFQSDRDGDNEIFKMDTDPATNDATRLTKNSANDSQPVWSPNGMKIAFASSRAGNFEIYTMKPNGTALRRLTKNPTGDAAPDWSPSGKKIAYQSFRGITGGDEIFTMRADGSRKRNLTNNAAGDQGPAFSPDGTQIAFFSNRDGNIELYTMNSDGSGTPTRLTNDSRSDDAPDWQPL